MARPKGSKNKIKILTPEKEIRVEKPGNKKDTNQEIKRLKKLKLQCRPGSQERIELHRQIKLLKAKLVIIKENITPEKEELIKKIEARKPIWWKDLNIDLTVFTIEELKEHYNLIITGRSRL